MRAFALFLALLLLPTALAAGQAPAAPTSYSRDIRPLLDRHCQACHQPAMKQGSLDLTTHAAFRAGGAKGPAFHAGAPEKSAVIGYLTGDRKPRMPFGAAPLADAEIELFRRWIAAGARDDTPPVSADTRAAAPGNPPVYHLPPMINALAWSPDGTLLAVSGYREVLLHRLAGPAPEPAQGAGQIAGQRALPGNSSAGLAGDSTLAARLAGVSDRIQSLVFSDDGRLLVAAGGTPARFGEVQFWDVAEKKLTRSVTLTGDTLFGASLAPDGARLAVGAADNTVRVVEIASARELLKLGHHENWVLGTVFGTDGARLVSVGRDRAAKLIDSRSGAFIENLNLLREPLFAIARHPRRDWVLVGGEERVPYLYMMDRPKAMKIADDTTLVRKFDAQGGPIFAAAFSPDGSRIAVGGSAAEVSIYNADTGERVAACTGHLAGIYALAFHPSGDSLATGGFDGHVRTYDVKTGKLLRDFVPVPLEK